MRTRFLLGPAGTGKTFRCLAEIRAALKTSPEGDPLILLAPKQATFQLERQLLADESLAGYTRLQIFSFERLADFVLTKLRRPPAKILSEEGRVMVLRALLLRNRDQLGIFRGSARQPGFAQQLSLVLRELQRHQLSAATLLKLSKKVEKSSQLSAKLHDLAFILGAYFDWLAKHQLQDANSLLDLASEVLRAGQKSNAHPISIAGFWLDGFAEMTPQEIDLLAAVIPNCDEATLAFCLDASSDKIASDLSIWSVVNKTFQECFDRLGLLPDCRVEIENLPRDPVKSRFNESKPLRHLEKHWSAPTPLADSDHAGEQLLQSLRLTTCMNPQAEAVLAAHEILRHVRAGGRFRNVAVLLRHFDGYHDVLRRTFTRYEIPFFLDRRESVAHHPLAELTRSALRLAAFNWEHDDFFSALKTGLVVSEETLVDQLENESLARGWRRDAWLQPFKFSEEQKSLSHLELFRQRVVPAFQKFCEALAAVKFSPDGPQLVEAIRHLWANLQIEEQIAAWAETNPVHATALEQMQSWLDNIEFAFESFRLVDWLPILESGLSGMKAGVIPPALDQVLIGTVDRSRNPDLELVLVLGLNELIFPAPPPSGNLLTESDYSELSKQEVALGPNKLETLGRERFYGYIACTRSRKRLVLTCSSQDNEGRAQNPSPFFSLFKQLFPTLIPETISTKPSWIESIHRCDLIAPLIQSQTADGSGSLKTLSATAVFDSVRERLEHFSSLATTETLSPAMAGQIYGTTLKTSVSALEQFAACPFRFFVSAGLRVQERRVFEVDVRERGMFQHMALATFHEQVQKEGKRWRDLTPFEARARMEQIGADLATSFRDGLFGTDAQSEWVARNLTESLQDFIEASVAWMQQYEFDPHVVELGFGTKEKHLPAWEINLGQDRKMALRGIIDRVDLCRLPDRSESMAVIIDYKSSAKQLDPLSLAHGLQLQLPAYLAFLRRLPDSEKVFGVKKLVPAGVFYVNFRGEFSGGKTRTEVLDGAKDVRQNAYQHAGRFDFSALRLLDNRATKTGTQFNYRLKDNGQPHGSSREIMATEGFGKLLDEVEQHLLRMGNEIYSGGVKIDPYQKGNVRACDVCDYRSICRIDPWTHEFNILKKISPTPHGSL
ncbi:MAG: PD-(D/E)XK nuclease family protein [Verrucomicrobiota bacterium]